MAGELKSENVMVNLEPTIHRALQKFIGKEGLSASAYCRILIIRDLQGKGVLTDEHLARMTAAGARRS